MANLWGKHVVTLLRDRKRFHVVTSLERWKSLIVQITKLSCSQRYKPPKVASLDGGIESRDKIQTKLLLPHRKKKFAYNERKKIFREREYFLLFFFVS